MSTTIQRLLTTEPNWGALALRVPVGIIFIAHGAQKLFGLFGGYGLEGTGDFFASIGLQPGTSLTSASIWVTMGSVMLFITRLGSERTHWIRISIPGRA